MISFSPDLPIEQRPTRWWNLHTPDGTLKAETSNKEEIKQFHQKGDSITQIVELVQVQVKSFNIEDL